MGSVFGTGGRASVCLARSLQQHGSCIQRRASKAGRVHTEAVSAARGSPRIAAANRAGLARIATPILLFLEAMRDAPWSCGNRPAYHSMIHRRSVPALHRACLHQRRQPEVKAPDVNLRPSLLKTDMTVACDRMAGGRNR